MRKVRAPVPNMRPFDARPNIFQPTLRDDDVRKTLSKSSAQGRARIAKQNLFLNQPTNPPAAMEEKERENDNWMVFINIVVKENTISKFRVELWYI